MNLLEQGYRFEPVGEKTKATSGSDGHGPYIVSFHEGRYTGCDCLGYQRHKKCCHLTFLRELTGEVAA